MKSFFDFHARAGFVITFIIFILLSLGWCSPWILFYAIFLFNSLPLLLFSLFNPDVFFSSPGDIISGNLTAYISYFLLDDVDSHVLLIPWQTLLLQENVWYGHLFLWYSSFRRWHKLNTARSKNVSLTGWTEKGFTKKKTFKRKRCAKNRSQKCRKRYRSHKRSDKESNRKRRRSSFSFFFPRNFSQVPLFLSLFFSLLLFLSLNAWDVDFFFFSCKKLLDCSSSSDFFFCSLLSSLFDSIPRIPSNWNISLVFLCNLFPLKGITVGRGHSEVLFLPLLKQYEDRMKKNKFATTTMMMWSTSTSDALKSLMSRNVWFS